MSAQAKSTFEITGWDQSTYDEPAAGPPLARATVTKRFSGDLEGESVAEVLLCQADDAGAGYLAAERVAGTLAGRSGTFVVQHGGVLAGAETLVQFAVVVPGSATGGLAGLTGTGRYEHDAAGARFSLDYDLP